MNNKIISERDQQDLRRGQWMLNYQIDDLSDLQHFWSMYKMIPKHPLGL